MSFSSQVKTELFNTVNKDGHCQLAELTAIISFSCKLAKDDSGNTYIKLDSDNEKLQKKYSYLVNKTTGISNFERLSNEEAKSVLKTVKMLNEKSDILNVMMDYVDDSVISESCCKRAYIRGAYEATGTITNPEKGYHFEIVCKTMQQAEQLRDVIESFGLWPKIVSRKNHFVLYLKDGAQIAEILNVMEAHKSMMELENVRILKDMRNAVNRKVNCETANITKTINASVKQVEDIELIQKCMGISNLPEPLAQMATVRLEHPEVPLKELGAFLQPPIGKSGVNHRLRKISEIADNFRR